MRFRFALFLILAAAQAQAQEDALPTLSVMADTALSLPMAAIARAYARDSGTAVALGFTDDPARGNLGTEGSNTDALVTMRSRWLEEVRQQGLADIHSETVVAAGRLVLVGPIDAPDVRLAEDIPSGRLVSRLGTEAVVAVGNPETFPEGGFAREAVKRLGGSADMEPYMLYTKDREQMLEMVRENNAYAIVLGGSARAWGLHVVDAFPASSHQPIEYRAVALAGERMDEARRFLSYLRSRAAKEIFAAYGMGL